MDTYSDRHSIADQITPSWRKLYDGLNLRDALCLVASKSHPNFWSIFRLPEFIDEIPRDLDRLMKPSIVIEEGSFVCLENLSAHDMNAKDWRACYILDQDKYLSKWVEHKTGYWPGNS